MRIDPKDQQPGLWFFTFPASHPLGQYYVIFFDTFAGAKLRMNNLFGSGWAMQYSKGEFGDAAQQFRLLPIVPKEWVN